MAEKEYIERGALIDKIFPIGLIDDGRYVIPAKAVKTAIDKAPTADVAPVVHADWIPHEHVSRSPYARNYDCSACGNSPIETGDFCNKCGAKMDGGKAE